MNADPASDVQLLEASAFYREFLLERNEILRHKWIESEKAGRDIGFEKALLDWVIRHRSAWIKARRRMADASRADISATD